jgi:hypothetical protein
MGAFLLLIHRNSAGLWLFLRITYQGIHERILEINPSKIIGFSICLKARKNSAFTALWAHLLCLYKIIESVKINLKGGNPI